MSSSAATPAASSTGIQFLTRRGTHIEFEELRILHEQDDHGLGVAGVVVPTDTVVRDRAPRAAPGAAIGCGRIGERERVGAGDGVMVSHRLGRWDRPFTAGLDLGPSPGEGHAVTVAEGNDLHP